MKLPRQRGCQLYTIQPITARLTETRKGQVSPPGRFTTSGCCALDFRRFVLGPERKREVMVFLSAILTISKHIFFSTAASLARRVCLCAFYTRLCIHAHVVLDGFFFTFSRGSKQNLRRLRTEKWAKEHTLSEEIMLPTPVLLILPSPRVQIPRVFCRAEFWPWTYWSNSSHSGFIECLLFT